MRADIKSVPRYNTTSFPAKQLIPESTIENYDRLIRHGVALVTMGSLI